AILYYSQATRFSRSAGGYFGRASMLFELRKPDLANEILREAGELNSRTSAELSEIAAAYWRGQQFEDAAKAFRVVLERRPLDHQVLLSLAQLYVAQLQQPEKAQPYIASLIENYPADARGWLLKSAGKSEAECHEALKKYLSLVDRNDPYETSMIAQAEARINVLETQGVGVHKQ
ncbi:MAG: tetratricopeptide repeat protein, partial [Dokdonella sp.]